MSLTATLGGFLNVVYSYYEGLIIWAILITYGHKTYLFQHFYNCIIFYIFINT